jgi:hypothetical protein
LRTEEKKREKERQSAAPVTPVITTPAENDATPTEPVPEQKQPVEASIEIPETAAPVESKDVESKDVEATNEAPVVDAVVDTDAPEPPALATEVWRSISMGVLVQCSNLLSLKQMATPSQKVTRPPMPAPPPLPTQMPSPLPTVTSRLEMNRPRRIRPNSLMPI